MLNSIFTHKIKTLDKGRHHLYDDFELKKGPDEEAQEFTEDDLKTE